MYVCMWIYVCMWNDWVPSLCQFISKKWQWCKITKHWRTFGTKENDTPELGKWIIYINNFFGFHLTRTHISMCVFMCVLCVYLCMYVCMYLCTCACWKKWLGPISRCWVFFCSLFGRRMCQRFSLIIFCRERFRFFFFI